MELGFEFSCSKPGSCVSGRKLPSSNVHFAPLFLSSAFINGLSCRLEALGTSTSLRGEQVPQYHFWSSGLWNLDRKNLRIANKPHNVMCSRAAASPANSKIGLSATKMDSEDSQKDEAEDSEEDETEELLEDEGSEHDGSVPGSKVGKDISEFRLSGDETELEEVGQSLFSVQTVVKAMTKTGDVGKQFIMNNIAAVVGIVKMIQRQPEQEPPGLPTGSIEIKDGATAVHEWSATELTTQHDQLARIASDINYLVFAFAFFGSVRIVEAVLAVFATYPPVVRRMVQSSNAVDYLAIAWLAYNLRKSITSLLEVDPTDLQRVATLKVKLWEELHAFFRRQWKVMAMVAAARFLGVVARYIPPSHNWSTKSIQTVWNTMMMMILPVF